MEKWQDTDMEIEGKIIAVLEERSGIAKGSGKPYRVARYVLETSEQYPKKVLFEVFGDVRINSMAIKEGEEMTVSFDIDAREYNGRWYNQLSAWKVERQSGNKTEPTASHPISKEELTPLPFTEELPFAMEEPPF